MTHPDDHNEYENDGCPCCGGEGFIFDCFDGFCLDADIGCDDCTRRCPECNRPRESSHHDGQVPNDAPATAPEEA